MGPTESLVEALFSEARVVWSLLPASVVEQLFNFSWECSDLVQPTHHQSFPHNIIELDPGILRWNCPWAHHQLDFSIGGSEGEYFVGPKVWPSKLPCFPLHLIWEVHHNMISNFKFYRSGSLVTLSLLLFLSLLYVLDELRPKHRTG